MKIADVVAGRIYRAETHLPGSEKRSDLERALGWTTLEHTDSLGLCAHKPAGSPPEVMDLKGGPDALLPVTWHGYDKPTVGAKVLVTIEIRGVRHGQITGSHLIAYTSGWRLHPFDIVGHLAQLRRRMAWKIAHALSGPGKYQLVGDTHIIWPGHEVGLEGHQMFSRASEGTAPDPAAHVRVLEVNMRAPGTEEQPAVLVELPGGETRWVDPLDLLEDRHGSQLKAYQASLVKDLTVDHLEAAQSALAHLVPDEARGHGRCWTSTDGVFLSWDTLAAIFIDNHEDAATVVTKLAEAAMYVIDARAQVRET